MRCAWVLILQFALVLAAAIAGPAEEASAAIDRWAAAYNPNDADAVVKLYAPDAILLGTSSLLMAEGTAPIRVYFSRLPGSGNKVVIGERRMVVLNDGVVLGAGFYDFALMQKGVPVPTPARFTMIIVKRNGEWFIAHHHSSQRPKPSQ